MEFLGIGYQELLLVLILLLVVVGPERLPNMAYQIGKAVRTMQKYARAVRDEFREEIDYLDEQVRTVRGELGAAGTMLREEQARLDRDLADIKPASLEGLLSTGETPAANGHARTAPPANAVPGALPPPASTTSTNDAAATGDAKASPPASSGPPLVF